MTTRQSVMLSLAIVGLFTFLLIIIFGDKGLADLHLLRLEHDRLVDKHQALLQENLGRFAAKQRLEKDPLYIEHVARRELGFVAPDELIFMVPESSSAGETGLAPPEP